jgi:FkbH-like protein
MVSKNNEGDVCNLFRKRTDMPLQLRHFSSRRVNWADKHANLVEISRELGLGLESFVFLDDQAFEKRQMQHYLPQVRVLPAQEDPLGILDALRSTTLFDGLKVGKEDRRRAREYERSAKRTKLQAKSHSTKEFLRSLRLATRVRPVTHENMGRVVQLLLKTNQFNATTRRHDEASVRTMIADKRNSLLAIEAKDRFGDQGIVGLGFALATPESGEYRIDSFLLSCRALGRGVEQMLWHELMKDVHKKRGKQVKVEYLNSGRNAVVLGFFETLGLKKVFQETKCTASLP